MSMNIKEPEAHALARKVAQQTGESLTQAVTVALRERLARLKGKANTAALTADLLAIGHRCASTLRRKPVDHGKLLYDERGLPK